MKRRFIVYFLVFLMTSACVPRNQSGPSLFDAWSSSSDETMLDEEVEVTNEALKTAIASNNEGQKDIKRLAKRTKSAYVLTIEANKKCFKDSGLAIGVDYAGAFSGYRKALSLEDSNTFTLVSQATCFARRGREIRFSGGRLTDDQEELREATRWLRRALSSARRALKNDPKNSAAHFTIAEIHALSGSFDEALSTLTRMEELKVIPRNRMSAYYSWRAYVKKSIGDSSYREDAQLAIDTADPMAFAVYGDQLLYPDDFESSDSLPAVEPQDEIDPR